MTYTVKDVADRYDVRENTVLGWIHSGELRAVNVGTQPGKVKPRWRITEESLRVFEEMRTPTPPVHKKKSRKKRSTSEHKFY